MSFDIPMQNRFALHTASDAKRVKRSESLIKLDRIYCRSLQSKLMKLPTNYSFKTVIENNNFTVIGLFRIKIRRNKYNIWVEKLRGKFNIYP